MQLIKGQSFFFWENLPSVEGPNRWDEARLPYRGDLFAQSHLTTDAHLQTPSQQGVFDQETGRVPAPQRPLTNHCSNLIAYRSSRGDGSEPNKSWEHPGAGKHLKAKSSFHKSLAFAKTGNSEKIHSQENSSWAMGRAQASSRENVRIQTKVLRPCLEIKGS